MNIVVGLVLVAALGIIAITLASAPLYARYSAAECRRAYASARTLGDSIRVDLHPYHGAPIGRAHRCGEVRARLFESAADVPVLPQPNEEL
jgi:hypothetical protein